MAERRYLAAHLINLRKIERSGDDAGLRTGFGEDLAPRINNDRVAICLAAILMLAALRGGNDVATRLDGAGAQQDVPVRLSRDLRERGGHSDDLGAGDSELAE